MRLNRLVFKKHKYVVKCERCGEIQANNDDGVVIECELLQVSRCTKCSPESAGVPIQIPYTGSGERIYA